MVTNPNPFGLRDVLLILLGWFLGIVGQQIIAAIAKRYRRKEVRRGLVAELREVRGLLAANASQMALKYGTFDKAFLNWQLPIARVHRGLYAAGMLTLLEDAAKIAEDSLSAIVKEASAAVGDRGYSMKKFETPYLTAMLGSLNMFPAEFEQTAFDIHRRLGIINGEIETAWFFFTKTFDAGPSTEIAKVNAHGSYKSIGRLCKDAADLIGTLDPAILE